ncbi:MAG: ATP-binding cassette domain-containing protein [Gemmatimonadaceae bacterium]|nr:ATP-binding cassette domain-containing protein [Gemmatimonadaceae bacterium]MDQ3243028.1 ATP-binding cassette domain-containing protein [Gemmatimonadota bacterium]
MLSVERVSKQFGTVIAVDDVSMNVQPGEIVALLGPNGAGKSTLIRMIVGLIRPDSGKVARAWEAAANGEGRDGTIGYLPEERGLYQDMPILRTLSYFGTLQGMPPRQATSEAAKWLERLELDGRGSDKVKVLSKGNQQKVQFVASVLHRPALAILDEPFSGLDPLNQELFLQLIRELRASGMTVIFSAHQMTLVERLADRVFLMNRGRQVLSGTIAELRGRWHTGERLIIAYSGTADMSFLSRIASIEEVESVADGEIRVRLKSGAGISDLLRGIGERLEVSSVRGEATTLHEIYVRTVEADNPASQTPLRSAS